MHKKFLNSAQIVPWVFSKCVLSLLKWTFNYNYKAWIWIFSYHFCLHSVWICPCCHRWLTTHIISLYFPSIFKIVTQLLINYSNFNPLPCLPYNFIFRLSFHLQFHDKMDPLLETLEGAVQRLRQPPPVAAEVEKIREQLAEHRAQGLELDKLLPSFSALCSRGEELIGRAAHDDPAAQGESLGCVWQWVTDK